MAVGPGTVSVGDILTAEAGGHEEPWRNAALESILPEPKQRNRTTLDLLGQV
jgi:hypothetical protein